MTVIALPVGPAADIYRHHRAKGAKPSEALAQAAKLADQDECRCCQCGALLSSKRHVAARLRDGALWCESCVVQPKEGNRG